MKELIRPSSSIRWFYPAATLLLLLLTLWGFHFFYFGGRAYPGHDLAPPIRGLLVGHGLLMTAWMFIALLQPALVATRRRKLHMAIGKVAAGLAVVIVVVGYLTAVESVKITPPELVRFTLSPKPFLMVPLSAITLFAIYIGIGVSQRKKPSIHGPFMFLASLAAISAALGRITVINNALGGGMLEQWLTAFISTSMLALLLWAIKCFIERKVDVWFGIAAAALVVWFTVCSQIARSDWWEQVATTLLGG